MTVTVSGFCEAMAKAVGPSGSPVSDIDSFETLEIFKCTAAWLVLSMTYALSVEAEASCILDGVANVGAHAVADAGIFIQTKDNTGAKFVALEARVEAEACVATGIFVDPGCQPAPASLSDCDAIRDGRLSVTLEPGARVYGELFAAAFVGASVSPVPPPAGGVLRLGGWGPSEPCA